MTIRRSTSRPAALIGALAAGVVVALAGSATAAAAVTQVSADPFQNTTSQHATEVEPDTFASGLTVVGAFQVGRFFNGGATDIGFARSTDGGATWSNGFLPGLTFSSGLQGSTGGSYERVSDPSVAFDAKHGVWLISSIPLLPNLVVPTVFVSRSTSGGATWDEPVPIPAPAVPASKVNLDKNWTVCDNTSTSPFYGNCYTEFDNFGQGDLEYMSTSSDGGLTWSTPVPTAGNDKGLGGQPLVQPSGRVIVPFESLNGKEAAFQSTNGGASWTRAVTISSIQFHGVLGPLRTSPLPTAEIDGAGNVYVAWEDCRFEKRCSANDIVFSKSSDGTSWSGVQRIPIDAVGSGADHFIPGLGVDKNTSGAGAHLALTYYFYPDATCSGSSGCQLEVGYISSPDGGGHWGDAVTLAGPMSLSDIANTSQGRMVGDYISTSFNPSGNAIGMFMIGKSHTAAQPFDEGAYVPVPPLGVTPLADAHNVASGAGVQVTGQGTGTAHQAIRDD